MNGRTRVLFRKEERKSMKRLLSLFFWFCAASVIAQACILGLSFFRGNLSKKSLIQIVALMNGIDIPGERLKNAIAAGHDVYRREFFFAYAAKLTQRCLVSSIAVSPPARGMTVVVDNAKVIT